MRLETVKTIDYRLILFSIASSISIFFLFSISAFDIKTIAAIFMLSVSVIILLNTDIAICLAIILLFAKFNILFYRVAVYGSIPIVLSYIITYRHRKTVYSNVANPIILPHILFFLLMLVSYLNTTRLMISVIVMLNFISMSLVIYCIGTSITNYRQIAPLIFVFLTVSALNGLHVIHGGITEGGRKFGFMGVTYVDFVCIAILILFGIALYYRKFILNSILVLFFSVSFFYTQTRSTMLALLAALIVGLAFIYINSEKFFFKKSVLLKYFLAAALCLTVIFIFITSFQPETAQRFSELSSGNAINLVDEKSFGQSSIITRVLIWYTALNAIKAHPIIGIGAYSFPFESFYYNTLPSDLFKLFVNGLTPHITYLAVLTETGIIGLVGFLLFLISTIAMPLRAFFNARAENQKYFSFGILLVQIYIACSMFVSDAWLWGQCGMLWSLVLGISLANYKIIVRSNRVHTLTD